MNARALSLIALIVALAPSARAADAAKAPLADEARVVIYRCTDAQDRLTLRDSPCRRGERQDIRTMVRPKDPPPKLTATNTARATAHIATSTAPQIVIVHTPRPLYECTRPDDAPGKLRYLSDTPEGKLRWVPRPDGPVLVSHHHHRPVFGPNEGFVQISDARHARPFVYDNGTWVRDNCYALPPADACERLREERGHLGRRRFNAQQSEREQIHREERSVQARLAQDCS